MLLPVMIFPVFACDKGALRKRNPCAWSPSGFFIIDGAPRIEKGMTYSIKLADYILIPLKPSQFDIWACKDSMKLVQAYAN